MKTFFLPESMYHIDEHMTYEILQKFYESELPITGRTLRFDETNQLIEVDLGGGIVGKLTISEATIYPIYKGDGNLSPNIFTLIGNTIRVKIKFLDTDTGTIYLSRKENMLNSLEFLKTQTSTIQASICGFTRTNIFVDMGGGILGKIYISDLVPTRVNDVQEVDGIEINSIISVKILKFIEELQKFEASHSLTIPPAEDILSEGDIVLGKVFDKVDNNCSCYGHFVLVKNSYAGIIDDPEKKLQYGDTIVVFIKKIKEDNKLKLTFVKKI